MNYKLKDFSINLLISGLICSLVFYIGHLTIDIYFTIQESQNLKQANIKLMALLKKVDNENGMLKYRESRVSAYESELVAKMSKLESVILAASKLNMISKSDLGVSGKEIGGLETECLNEDCYDRDQAKASIDLNTAISAIISRAENFTDILNRIPFLAPVQSFVSSGYGARRSPFGGKKKHHGGIDFSAPYGSEVLSTADGVIKKVSRSGTYGIFIDIDHGNNVLTRYAHLSETFAKKGEKVCATQRIGLVGSTGRSTGAHLHYEIRVNGKTIDPLELINF